MSDAVTALREELTKLRDRLASLQRDESAVATSIEDLERQLAAQRRRRQSLTRQAKNDVTAIEAVEAALTVLTERLPVAELPAIVSAPIVKEAVDKERPSLVKNPSAAKILRDAEELDRGDLSQRSRERAELVRRALAQRDGPVLQEDLVKFVLAECAPVMSESKARTAVEVGLTVLVADGRARCVNSVSETWDLTAPERASANLGVQIAGFKGRTTRWPGPTTTPPPGTRIVLEEGSYEGGKKR